MVAPPPLMGEGTCVNVSIYASLCVSISLCDSLGVSCLRGYGVFTFVCGYVCVCVCLSSLSLCACVLSALLSTDISVLLNKSFVQLLQPKIFFLVRTGEETLTVSSVFQHEPTFVRNPLN